LHDYIDNYEGQLHTFCTSINPSSIEIVFDIKPKFYSATPDSPSGHLLVCAGGRLTLTPAKPPNGSSGAA